MTRVAKRVVVEFASADALVATLHSLRDEGYEHVEVYEPYPSERIDALLPERPTRIGWIMLAAGATGAAGAYFLQWFASRDYPLNVGGRPLHSWPAFVPVTFELTVLSAAIAGVVALLWFARLPRLDHPMFAHPRFERASQDRFFLVIRTSDPRYTEHGLKSILRAATALSIEEAEG